MKTNIGHIEMLLRLFAGIALADLSIDQATYGHTNIIGSLFAMVLIITALAGFCPLYALLFPEQASQGIAMRSLVLLQTYCR